MTAVPVPPIPPDDMTPNAEREAEQFYRRQEDQMVHEDFRGRFNEETKCIEMLKRYAAFLAGRSAARVTDQKTAFDAGWDAGVASENSSIAPDQSTAFREFRSGRR